MAKRKRGRSKLQRLKALASKRKTNAKWSNRIIDGITISFGVNNILPTTLRTGGNFMTRIKTGINEVVGRTTGASVFPDAPQFSRVFNIANAFSNPQTTAALAALGYNIATKYVKILPLKAESRRFFKQNFAVGIGTGLFGDSGNNTPAAISLSGGQSQSQGQEVGISN